MRLGNCAAPTTPSCARDSASLTVATCTSRFSAATRRSSAVSWGSWNRFHQSGSIGSATGRLGGRWIGSAFLANQDAGDSHSGVSKFGPTVQPASSSSGSGGRYSSQLALVSAAPGRRLRGGSYAGSACEARPARPDRWQLAGLTV